MGLDAKGRNFSAPRLTPGKSSESLVYGSPNMLKNQEQQIAVMEARARRYGFGGIKSVNSSTLGTSSSISNSLSNVPYGTQKSTSPDSFTAKPITAASNPNNHSTMANSARGYASASTGMNSKPSAIIVIIMLLFMFGPIILPAIIAIIVTIIRGW